MKYILIIVILGVAGYFGWQALQTQPDPSVPQAVVTDTTASPTPTTPAAQQPQGETPAEVRMVDNQNVKVSFRGFGPGKEHVGSFSKLTSDLTVSDEKRVMPAATCLDDNGSKTPCFVSTGKKALSGVITVDMNSMTTDNERLTGHLKSKDFFEVAKYPTATFSLTSISNGRATGSMTIRGIKKDISFPITILESNPQQYAAKFTLNMKDFGINQTFANETIELSVVVPLK